MPKSEEKGGKCLVYEVTLKNKKKGHVIMEAYQQPGTIMINDKSFFHSC